MAPGKRNGQTILVKNGSSVSAHTWNETTSEWDKVGDVVGAKPENEKKSDTNKESGKIYYEGKYYDYIFDVDVDDNLPTLKLPYNINDNPWQVANEFLMRYGLPLTYQQQVVDFIIENSKGITFSTGEGTDPFTGGSRYVPGGGNVSTVNQYFPQNTHLFFEKINAEGIAKKLREFHDFIPPDVRLNVEDITLLLKLADLSLEIQPQQISLVKMLLSWPKSHIFPALDLIRASLLIPKINEELSASKDSARLIDTLLVCATDSSSDPNQLLALRALCNMFSHPVGEALVFTHAATIFKALNACPLSTNKNIQIAQSTLYLNYAVSFYKTHQHDGLKFECLTAVFTMMKPDADPEVQFRLLVSIGTLIQNDSNVLQLIKSEDVVSILDALTKRLDNPEKLIKCAQLLLKIIK